MCIRDRARVIPSGPGTPTPLGVAEPMRLSRLRFRRWMALDRCGSRVPLQVNHGDQQWMMGTITGFLSGHGSVTVSVVAGGPERVSDHVLCRLDGLDDQGDLCRAAPVITGENLPAFELTVAAFPDRADTGQRDVGGLLTGREGLLSAFAPVPDDRLGVQADVSQVGQ